MKKIILLACIALTFTQCKKQNELPDLAKDNDYSFFNLKDRVCEIKQTVELAAPINFEIEDRNITYIFNTQGYLVQDSIYNHEHKLMEINTYEKIKYPLTKKQFITSDNFILKETAYDSLKNIVSVKKSTSKDQIIEELRNTFSDNYLVQEEFYSSGNTYPTKRIAYTRNGDVIKSKVIYSQTGAIIDSVAYEYDGHLKIKETHFNSNKQKTATELFGYENNEIQAIVYLNAEGTEEAVEKFNYNEKKQLVNKYVFSAIDQSTYEEINTYNKKGTLDKSETKLNNKVLTTTIFKYDEFGNLIDSEFINYTNKESIKKTFKYTYDEKGNWLTKEVILNSKPLYKVVRVIKYC